MQHTVGNVSQLRLARIAKNAYTRKTGHRLRECITSDIQSDNNFEVCANPAVSPRQTTFVIDTVNLLKSVHAFIEGKQTEIITGKFNHSEMIRL